MPSTATSSIGVVIVSWNVRELLRRCLATARRSERPLRIIVVDNASTDDSAAMVRAEFPGIALIANPDNRGFTRANNQGFRALGIPPRPAGALPLDGTLPPPDYVLILNPDTEIEGDAIAVLADYLDRHPAVAAVGPLLLYPDGTVQPSRRRFPTLVTGLVESTPIAWHWSGGAITRRYRMADRPVDAAGPVDWLVGAAILLRGAALADLGGFDEGFFMYSEELDLCKRLANAGWAVHYCPEARIVHHEGRSSAQVAPARHLHFQRSRVRYFRKHHGRLAAGIVRLGILAAFAAELLIEAAKWLVGHKRALRRARVAAYWSLLRDGLGPEPAGWPPRPGAATPGA